MRSIVFLFHEALNHIGKDFVLARIRQYYWVLHGRKVVKASKSRPSCIREKAKPVQMLMGDLSMGDVRPPVQ